jgi:nucleotide-binding universal stress UspA family protein
MIEPWRRGLDATRGPPACHRKDTDMKKILVAYDGGQPGRKALDTAIDLAQRYGAELDVVSVVPIHAARAPMDPWDDRELHQQELDEARAIVDASGLKAGYLEEFGAVGPTIEAVAREGGYDTVVVGSRGLGAVSRFLQGSVSEHVVTHTDATVVVAR